MSPAPIPFIHPINKMSPTQIPYLRAALLHDHCRRLRLGHLQQRKRPSHLAANLQALYTEMEAQAQQISTLLDQQAVPPITEKEVVQEREIVDANRMERLRFLIQQDWPQLRTPETWPLPPSGPLEVMDLSPGYKWHNLSDDDDDEGNEGAASDSSDSSNSDNSSDSPDSSDHSDMHEEDERDSTIGILRPPPSPTNWLEEAWGDRFCLSPEPYTRTEDEENDDHVIFAGLETWWKLWTV